MKWFRADLHIHSVLSPCGGLEMSPSNVADQAEKKGIDIIAITDHNACYNLPAYKKVLENKGLVFIPGVEIQTSEEIHVIALFNSIEATLDFGDKLYQSLLPVKNDPDYFGDQVVIDEDENIKRIVDKALINSSTWSFDETFQQLSDYDALVYPAHVDALSFSVIGQLGFIPPHLNINTIEITAKGDINKLLKDFPYLSQYGVIRSSDAHYLDRIGSGFTDFFLEEPSLNEIRKAVLNRDGRLIKI